jgi:multimeric flavodoxin WrbA
MNVLCISGSPRASSNTDYLLRRILDCIGGDLIKLTDYHIEPCTACWACVRTRSCCVDDDMTRLIIPKVLAADALVLGTPVYFNNVSAQLKAFIDRTWPLRGELCNKIGGTVVVGRRYGAEGAIAAMNAFFLKHEMIVVDRGVCGLAYRPGEVRDDAESLQASDRLARRILELGKRFVAVSS